MSVPLGAPDEHLLIRPCDARTRGEDGETLRCPMTGPRYRAYVGGELVKVHLCRWHAAHHRADEFVEASA